MTDIYNCEYIIGVDLGGVGQDRTAVSVGHIEGDMITIIECITLPENIRFDEKYRMIANVAKRFGEKTTLVLDATGLGAPIVEAVRTMCPRTIGVTITAAQESNQKDLLNWTVPKSVLVGCVQQTLGRSMKVSKLCNMYEDLKQEMQNFSYKANTKSLTDSYEAARGHDDLVMSVSYVAWFSMEVLRRAALYKPFKPNFDTVKTPFYESVRNDSDLSNSSW